MVGVLLIFVTLIIPFSTSCNFRTIFNFGDSNSDNGNTFFGSPAGRSCDGRLIIDFIGESLELPHLSSFLDSMGTNFSHGANFATMGASIRHQNTTNFISGDSPISLDVQYTEFSNFLKKSQIIRQRGDVFKNMFPSLDKFSSALYIFDIGQNDLTLGYPHMLANDEVKAYFPDVISQYMTVIKKVYASGGRTFWIHNTGPLGCLPYILDTQVITSTELDQYGCAIPFNEVSQYFNEKLKEAVIDLRKELPLATITYVDIYSVKYSLIAHANKLGFDDPLLACCGYGGGKYNFNIAKVCGTTEIVDGKKILIADSCGDPSSRIIWDGAHFTEAANKWIYGSIVDGSFSDPPVPLKMACHQKENKICKSTMDFNCAGPKNPSELYDFVPFNMV